MKEIIKQKEEKDFRMYNFEKKEDFNYIINFLVKEKYYLHIVIRIRGEKELFIHCHSEEDSEYTKNKIDQIISEIIDYIKNSNETRFKYKIFINEITINKNIINKKKNDLVYLIDDITNYLFIFSVFFIFIILFFLINVNK